jgi:hypothetical protein
MSSLSLAVTGTPDDGTTEKKTRKRTPALGASARRELCADVLRLSATLPRLRPGRRSGRGQFLEGRLAYRLYYTSAEKYVVGRLLLGAEEILQLFYNPQGYNVTITLPNKKLAARGLSLPEERTASKPARGLPRIIELIHFMHGDITILEDETLRARGIRKDLEKLDHPEAFIQRLFTDNRFETLRKVGLPIDDLLGWHYKDLSTTWYRQTLKMAAAGKKYNIGTWLDCLSMLQAEGRDINNPKVYLPDNLKALHAQLVKRREKTAEKQRRQARLEADKAYLASITREDLEAYKNRMARFAAITIGDGTWRITTLADIEDHFKDTVAVRVSKESNPERAYANAEIDFHSGEIRQLYGKLNTLLPKAEDQAIKDLIRHNINKYIAAGKKTASRPKLAVETFTPAFN